MTKREYYKAAMHSNHTIDSCRIAMQDVAAYSKNWSMLQAAIDLHSTNLKISHDIVHNVPVILSAKFLYCMGHI